MTGDLELVLRLTVQSFEAEDTSSYMFPCFLPMRIDQSLLDKQNIDLGALIPFGLWFWSNSVTLLDISKLQYLPRLQGRDSRQSMSARFFFLQFKGFLDPWHTSSRSSESFKFNHISNSNYFNNKKKEQYKIWFPPPLQDVCRHENRHHSQVHFLLRPTFGTQSHHSVLHLSRSVI